MRTGPFNPQFPLKTLHLSMKAAGGRWIVLRETNSHFVIVYLVLINRKIHWRLYGGTEIIPLEGRGDVGC